jgi:hypothetical protein
MGAPDISPQKSSIMPFQKLKCLSLVLCENVIEDKRTNNKSLIGLFNRITGPTLPLLYPKLCIVVSLTGGRGTVPINIRISSLQNNEEILKLSGEVTFNDSLAVIDLVLECRNVPFKKAGVHAMTVYAGTEQMIVERRFEVSVNEKVK